MKLNQNEKMGRKLATLLAVVAGWSLSVSAADYIAHWDFGSDSLGVVDMTGNNDLVNTNGVPIADGAMVFDGTVKEVITRDNVGFRDNQPYTIECFAQANEDCDGMIMELSPNITNAKGSFYIYAKEGVMVKGGNGGYNGEQFDAGNICDGQWHHIAVIVNPEGETAADMVQLYLDGIRQTKHVQNKTGSCLRPYRLYIGSRGGQTLPFKGKIDDVRITAAVLSTNQFLQARSAGSIDVRAYWKFDDGNALADSSGNGNTLQGSQGVTFVNGCASFNGTASNVRTVNKLDLSAYKDVTVECFVRRHQGADVASVILEHSYNWNVWQEFYLALNDKGAGSLSSSFNLGGTPRDFYSSSNVVNAGWHHVAIVKDSAKTGSDACVRLYVDGIQQTTCERLGRDSSAYLLNDYLYIGSRKNSSLFTDADIDDVRVTAGALLPGQFLKTRTGPLDEVIAYWPFAKATNMLEDATGNGNVLTGTGVTVNDGAAVFDGSQSGFATLATLPLYAYRSMTVEWFMKSSMSDVCIVLETSPAFNANRGAFCAVANEYAPAAIQAGYRPTTGGYNVCQILDVLDGKWHHVALVYDYDAPYRDTVRLYCDGIQTTSRSSEYNGISSHRSDRLYIGTRAGSQYPFVGELDDIKITGRALTPAEFMTKRSSPPGETIIIR